MMNRRALLQGRTCYGKLGAIPSRALMRGKLATHPPFARPVWRAYNGGANYPSLSGVAGRPD